MKLTISVDVYDGDYVNPEDLPRYLPGLLSALDDAVNGIASDVYPELVFSGVYQAR